MFKACTNCKSKLYAMNKMNSDQSKNYKKSILKVYITMLYLNMVIYLKAVSS